MNIQQPFLRTLAQLGSIALILCNTQLVTTAVAEEQQFAGKRIVHLLQEPRHRTVHKDGDINLLDVQVNAGDMSLPHVHDSAILVTMISTGEGPAYGRLSANTDYATETVTHEIKNDGPGMMRIIAMTNSGPGEATVIAGRPQGLQGTPEIENNWFRSYRVALQPGTETPMLLLDNPSVVVQVSEGKLHVTRSDGITAETDEMGKWAWRDAKSVYKVQNVGDAPIEFLINEARR